MTPPPLSFYSLHLRLWCFGRSRGLGNRPVKGERRRSLYLSRYAANFDLCSFTAARHNEPHGRRKFPCGWSEREESAVGTVPLCTRALINYFLILIPCKGDLRHTIGTAQNLLNYARLQCKKGSNCGRVHARKLKWDILWVTNEVLKKLGDLVLLTTGLARDNNDERKFSYFI